MKKETYQAARNRLIQEFKDLGFVVKDTLKVPQVELPTGETLLFKAQAVYTKSNKLSLWVDIRGMSARQLAIKAGVLVSTLNWIDGTSPSLKVK